jgi:hypothetical protein
MAGSVEELLAAIGFPGADALSELGVIGRQLDIGRETLRQSGESEREGINASYESRGLYNSGARGKSLAKQRASETQRGSALEASAAGDVAGLQRFLTQQETLAEAGDLQDQAGYNQSLDDLLYALGIAQEDSAYLEGQGSFDSLPFDLGGFGGGGSEKPKVPRPTDYGGFF